MALTTYLINQASDHITDKQIQLWLLLFKKSPKYQQYAYIYADTVAAKLAATEGTVKARMLNALMTEIDNLGVGEVHIGGDQRTIGNSIGDREGTHWSQTMERLALIEEGLDVLFEDITGMIIPGSPSGDTNLANGTTYAAVGLRMPYTCCSVCNRTYIYRNNTRFCGCY